MGRYDIARGEVAADLPEKEPEQVSQKRTYHGMQPLPPGPLRGHEQGDREPLIDEHTGTGYGSRRPRLPVFTPGTPNQNNDVHVLDIDENPDHYIPGSVLDERQRRYVQQGNEENRRRHDPEGTYQPRSSLVTIRFPNGKTVSVQADRVI